MRMRRSTRTIRTSCSCTWPFHTTTHERAVLYTNITPRYAYTHVTRYNSSNSLWTHDWFGIISSIQDITTSRRGQHVYARQPRVESRWCHWLNTMSAGAIRQAIWWWMQLKQFPARRPAPHIQSSLNRCMHVWAITAQQYTGLRVSELHTPVA